MRTREEQIRLDPVHPIIHLWRLLLGKCVDCGRSVAQRPRLWQRPRIQYYDTPQCLTCFNRRHGRFYHYMTRQYLMVERRRAGDVTA